LNRLEEDTGVFTRFQNDADPDSLSYNTIFDLFQDQQGLLWIGTFEGLDFYDPLRKPFRSYTSERSNPNSLSDRHVLGVLKDRSGIVWAGTPAGLDRIEGNQVTHYRHDPDDPGSLADNVVYALA
jgi:ligand-binding sensor domain-containing protein